VQHSVAKYPDIATKHVVTMEEVSKFQGVSYVVQMFIDSKTLAPTSENVF